MDKNNHAFLGHPKGLAYISFTEAWERFSYYGMQTLLVLYMVHQLLHPGHIEHIVGFSAFRSFIESIYGRALSEVALASAIFGLYTGLVYLTPIFGGLIADRWLGKTTTITIGALFMAAGHFLMAFDFSFLIALLCLLIGVGCFKGNLASQVSDLYAANDPRTADAFQIYYLFINGAVIISPLVTGTLGEFYGWHYGFGAAGVGMLFSLAIYLSGRKWLPVEEKIGHKESTPIARPRLTKKERRTVYILLFMLPILAIGVIGNQQIFNAYLLWVPDHVDLVFFGHVLPTTWLITLDATVSVSSLVLVLLFWRWWAKRYTEPSEIVKMTIGTGLGALGMLCLAIAAIISSSGTKAGIGWLMGFEILNSIGFSNLLPTGLSLYSRASPKAIAGTMMGFYYLHLFMGNNMVGYLGGFIETMSGTQFWLMHAGLEIGAMIVLYVIARWFGHYLMQEHINRA